MKELLAKYSGLIKKVLIPLILIIAYASAAAYSVRTDSATIDEKFHLVRGIMYLETGDLRINQHHPYLFNTLAALPTLFDEDINIPSTEGRDWDEARKDELSFELVDINGGHIEFTQNVLWGPRLMMIGLSAMMLVAFYFIAWKLFDFKIAIISTLLLALEPTFLAHSRLVTTDVPSMFTIFFASAALYNYLKNRTRTRLLVFIVAGFLALMTKYTAVVASVTWAISIMAVLFAYRESFRHYISQLVKVLGVIGISWIVMLSTAYHFDFATMEEMTYGHENKLGTAERSVETLKDEYSPTASRAFEVFFFDINYPFPQYSHGFYDNVIKHNIGGHSAFFMGEHSNGGWKAYFPVTYMLKLPLPTVALSFAALTTLIWVQLSRKYKFKNKTLEILPAKLKIQGHIIKPEDLALILPPSLILFMAINSSLNLGVRHLLPIMPFVMILTAWFVKNYILKLKYGLYILVAALTLNILSIGYQYPHLISYFNESIGSRQNGYLYLRDSNLNWQQNVIRVDEYVKSLPQSTQYIGEYYDEGEPMSGIMIIPKGRVYDAEWKMSPQHKVIRDLHESGDLEEIGYISNSHFIFEVDEEITQAMWEAQKFEDTREE